VHPFRHFIVVLVDERSILEPCRKTDGEFFGAVADFVIISPLKKLGTMFFIFNRAECQSNDNNNEKHRTAHDCHG